MWDACVLDSNLQDQLVPYMKKMKPRPSIYCPDFIAANQSDRADNVLTGEYLHAFQHHINTMQLLSLGMFGKVWIPFRY